jgi:hypothetical protein
MIDFPLISWYWIGGITLTLLTLIGLGVWFNYFWNPHIHSKNL